MKFTGQSKDGVLDSLLRAYVSRPSNPRNTCTEFDPDQANAYIERRLTGFSHSRFEQHLSECTGCRKNVVALMRLADAEVLTAAPAREVPQSRWFANIRQAFGALSRPQWALAATALLVLGISLPLIFSLNRNQEDLPAASQFAVANKPVDAGTSVSQTPASATAATGQPETAKPAEELRLHQKAADKFAAKPEFVAKNTQPASGDSVASTGIVTAASLSKKQEAGAVAPPVEERLKSENQVVQTQTQAPSVPGAQVARNEAQQARQQQPSEKDSNQKVAEPKSRSDQESAEREKAKRPEDAAAAPAPPPSTEASRDRASKRPSSKLALRDPNTGETVRVDERKINGKHFFLRGGAWTDKDYDPDKDLPIVTVIRDSNVYKELLTKRTGLKPIMERFTATERAIIVYKGTVYKLIPQ
jgi:hypothetical protein